MKLLIIKEEYQDKDSIGLTGLLQLTREEKGYSTSLVNKGRGTTERLFTDYDIIVSKYLHELFTADYTNQQQKDYI